MKVTPTLLLIGALTLGACGQAKQPSSASTSPQVTAATQPATPAQSNTPTLPALSPNPASRLQSTEPALQLATDTFPIYGLGGLAASSARTPEQYQQDISVAVIRNLASRLYLNESDIRIVSVQDSDVSACGGKQSDPISDDRRPGFAVLAEANGVTYRYNTSGALGYFCGEA